jgi:hypothetical protein
MGQDGASCRDDLPDAESEIFLQTGLDRQNPQNKTDLPVGRRERLVTDDDGRICGERRASLPPAEKTLADGTMAGVRSDGR